MIKKIRHWLIQAAGISKGEANALLILAPLLMSVIALPPYLNSHFNKPYDSQLTDQAILDSMLVQMQQDHELDSIVSTKKPQRKLKMFDPNSASISLLETNGIPSNIAQRIINYRDKGGEFRKKQDLLKIYGMRDDLYGALSPFIDIPIAAKTKTTAKSKFTAYSRPPISLFNLNTADTATLKQVYGIGNKLSSRIVVLRKQLGGYICTDQLAEVYGLDTAAVDSLLRYAHIEAEYIPHQININTDTISALSNHPYIAYRIAKAIVSYRRQHGDYNNIEELKNIHLMSDSIYLKIAPYLKIAEY
jgi:DNA uptake protein ComE-like DNA-binding protein